jgi:hypothetical protein
LDQGAPGNLGFALLFERYYHSYYPSLLITLSPSSLEELAFRPRSTSCELYLERTGSGVVIQLYNVDS